jgi:hypothetical protein
MNRGLTRMARIRRICDLPCPKPSRPVIQEAAKAKSRSGFIPKRLWGKKENFFQAMIHGLWTIDKNTVDRRLRTIEKR